MQPCPRFVTTKRISCPVPLHQYVVCNFLNGYDIYSEIKIVMKKNIAVLLAILTMVVCPPLLFAQIRNGSMVQIKNRITQTVVQTKGYTADSAVFTGAVNRANINLSQWRVITAPDGYLFQTKDGRHYMGIQSDTGADHNNLVLRRLTAANRNELLWILSATNGAYVFRTRKNARFMTDIGSAGGPFRNLVHSRSATGRYFWSITAADSTAGTAPDTAKKVLFDVTLNYIGVTEVTRNRVDNGDCRRVFGEIKTELWELGSNNVKVKKLAAYDNKPEFLFKQTNYSNPSTAAISYYQDNLALAAGGTMGTVTYNIPEALLNNRRVMLVIKAYLGTRHKDSDFSSYDALRMKEEKQFTFILENRGFRQELLQDVTERMGSEMKLSGITIPGNTFGGDDTHRLLMAVSWKKM